MAQFVSGNANAQINTSSVSISKQHESPLEMPLHDLIKTSVEDFKKFWKEEKGYIDEIASFSDTDLISVNTQIKESQNNLYQLQEKIKKSLTETQQLKEKIVKEIHLTEHFSRHIDVNNPAFIRGDYEYYSILIKEFLSNIDNLRNHMKELKIYLSSSYNHSSTGKPNVKVIAQVMNCMQEMIIKVAANLQTVHETIQCLKINGLVNVNGSQRIFSTGNIAFQQQQKQNSRINASSNVISAAKFSSFKSPLFSTASSPAVKFEFTNEDFDPPTSLVGRQFAPISLPILKLPLKSILKKTGG